MKINYILVLMMIAFSVKSFAQGTSKQKFIEARLSDPVIEPGSRIVLDKLMFQAANYLPVKSSEVYIDSLAMIMKKQKDLEVEICYIQTVWPKTVDVDLSMGRSEVLKEFLMERGIKDERISTTSTTHLFDPAKEDINKDSDKKNYYIEARFRKK